ncbi:MAG: tRNA (adenine-N1)-methyltransferase [Promethearchaeota archaeon]
MRELVPIRDGDHVLVVFDARRRWLVKVKAGEQFHTHRGYVEFDDLIGREFGHVSKTRGANAKFYAFRPYPSDFVVKMKRSTQIIYPEDVGLILVYTGIGPGSKVLEAGTGSGALTANLAYFVRPTGHVYTYDVREKSLKRARRNLEKIGLTRWVTVENRDVDDGFPEREADAVVLDHPSPWIVVPHAWEALAFGGAFCAFSPTIEQVKKTVAALRSHGGFGLVQAMELLKRDYQVRRNATRPVSQMVGHTGFLTFARKVGAGEGDADPDEKEKTRRGNEGGEPPQVAIPRAFFDDLAQP